MTGQRPGGGDRLGDRHVRPLALAEDDALGGVEVGRGQIELGLEHPEVVRAVGIGEHLLDVALDPLAGVEPARQRRGEPGREVDGRDLAQVLGQLAEQAGDLEREGDPAAGEAAQVRAQQRAEVDVAKRRGQSRVQHPHHLLGRDPVGDQAGDEGAGAGADVDVELVHRPVGRQQVDRPQGADLVDAAGEAAAAEHQRRLRRLAPRAALAGRPLRLAARGLDVDDLAHRIGKYPNRHGCTAVLGR